MHHDFTITENWKALRAREDKQFDPKISFATFERSYAQQELKISLSKELERVILCVSYKVLNSSV